MLKIKVIMSLVLLLPSLLLAQTSITDSQGEQHFAQLPQRVMALSWELTEQLIELQVPLIAMTDPAGYNEWVVNPVLPEGIEDLGGRAEPNLEKIAALKPDLILINDLQKPLLKRLAKIAPVLSFNTFSKEHSNPEVSIEIFRKLAVLFAREQLAERKLNQMQQRFKQLNAKLSAAYGGKLPQVTSVRFANSASVYIYGDNSMSQYALQQLGISSALPMPSTQWGLVQKRVLELSKIQRGSLLFFEPFPQWSQLQQSRLWQAMPIVRNNRVAAVPSTWTYGGAMSLRYLAEAMTDSLLTIAPDADETSADSTEVSQ
ncbi:MAG: iron-siderophore ABC transporter substrate-binding protein [Pseudomonadales bacterium]|nr:iron-siderophore ABC transporter substrate-binding protein [Pseudomonadales bacterium]NRA16265.1 iron-siderophore ABC transporter substrate-binding protein [Oceanospirillaceae bacterium]